MRQEAVALVCDISRLVLLCQALEHLLVTRPVEHMAKQHGIELVKRDPDGIGARHLPNPGHQRIHGMLTWCTLTNHAQDLLSVGEVGEKREQESVVVVVNQRPTRGHHMPAQVLVHRRRQPIDPRAMTSPGRIEQPLDRDLHLALHMGVHEHANTRERVTVLDDIHGRGLVGRGFHL